MNIINLFVLGFAAILLTWMLMKTRCYDSIGWWAYRFLAMYALVCFVYLMYDTNIAGHPLYLKYLFVRAGFLALVIAMVLSWRLIRKENNKASKQVFKLRIKDIFNIGDENG